MADNKKYTLILPEGFIAYDSKSAFIKRLEKEYECWAFLKDISQHQIHNSITDFQDYKSYLSGSREIQQVIYQVEKLAEGKTYYYTVSKDSKFPPFHDTLEGKAILAHKEKGNLDFALKILIGTLFSRYYIFPYNAHPPHTNSIAQAMSALDMVRSKTVNLDDATTSQISSLVEDARKEVEELTAYKENTYVEFAKLKDENKEMQDKFLEQMRYRAPVKLWEDRQKHHKDNSDKAISHFYIFCGLFSVLAIVYIYILISQGSNLFACNTQTNSFFSPCNVKIFTQFLVTTFITSMAIWFLKFKMKVHLSERHLALDAQERKAFAETFLALKEDRLVGAEQEAVVLQSLFRPTQDGIIKDDNALGMPSDILLGILSKK